MILYLVNLAILILRALSLWLANSNFFRIILRSADSRPRRMILRLPLRPLGLWLEAPPRRTMRLLRGGKLFGGPIASLPLECRCEDDSSRRWGALDDRTDGGGGVCLLPRLLESFRRYDDE